MQPWSPSSWQSHPCPQAIEYDDVDHLTSVLDALGRRPPLVHPQEILKLKQQLAAACRGESFILQGGDCAERYSESSAHATLSQLQILQEMSAILQEGLAKPVIRVGRIAGQYAKPRTQLVETKGEVSLPAYRGDLINQIEFTASARLPNPELLLKGYEFSAATLNHIRGAGQEFYTSHEALHLPYEQALTRQTQDGIWYNVSTHFPWIGMRTAILHQAHPEYCRGIANPVAVKIGPQMTTENLQALIQHLNPQREPGKLTLTTRLGASEVQKRLPDFIKATQDSQIPVVWICDPMHGNTHETQEGYKTRHFDSIVKECFETIESHLSQGSHLGGLHLELTGEPVTECIGGPNRLHESDLHRAYKSVVDPRLNAEQALEISYQIAKLMDTAVMRVRIPAA